MVNYSRDIPVLWLCRGLDQRTALHFHGSTSSLLSEPGHGVFKSATRLLLRLANGVMVLSSEEQKQWQEFYPPGRFFLTCNPFQPLANFSNQIENGWNLSPDVPTLLYVGRIVQEKGIYDLLDALALLGSESRFNLLVAGCGSEEQNFMRQIRALDLQGKVTMAGYLKPEQLQLAYASADLFVFPSWREGFPTVIAEAMHAGLPIVTTFIRGAADHLREGIHAWFVRPKSPVSLAAAISRALASPDLRAKMGQANGEKVKDFAPEKVSAQYLTLLNRIVSPVESSGSWPTPECAVKALK
jgi:glycosyltransferase involved in cell wall biosynthesis